MTEKREMTVREAGKKGGEAVKEKYGTEHFSRAGQLGGRATRKRGKEYYQRIGRMGGLKKSHEDLVEMAKRGGEATKKKKEGQKTPKVEDELTPAIAIVHVETCPECGSDNIRDMGIFEGWLECQNCEHIWRKKETQDEKESHRS